MTKEQMEFIASLAPDIDFRFEQRYGRTVVRVEWGGKTLEVDEDGTRFLIGPTQANGWPTMQMWKTETVKILGSESAAD